MHVVFKITIITAIVCFVILDLLLSVDHRTKKLKEPQVLYGETQNDMISVKAHGRALYLNKTTREGIFRPIPDYVHDMLFFPVTADDIKNIDDIAIISYNPFYPSWGKASPVFYEIGYNELKCNWVTKLLRQI